jgi:hypothetical protein
VNSASTTLSATRSHVVIGLVFINFSGPLNQSPHLPADHCLAQSVQPALMPGQARDTIGSLRSVRRLSRQ